MDETNFTVKEILVEIRGDVKDLAKTVARIDREGSIGTKQELSDHENRIRGLEISGFRLGGAWTTLTIVGAFLTGVAGLGLGLIAFLGG